MCMARRKNVYGSIKDLPVFKVKYSTIGAKYIAPGVEHTSHRQSDTLVVQGLGYNDENNNNSPVRATHNLKRREYVAPLQGAWHLC